ncbi:MAG: glycerol kinase GlpK [Clostridia bacterium]|nr:glycerol kinase GlpK [Clostridia bacterium]
MTGKYILALDEGTTSARAILFDNNAEIVSMAQQEFTQIYPQPGWVEHDPMEIWANQYSAMTACIAKSGISPDHIAAVGITNQRETTVVWDKKTGKPVTNAIVWQCRRTAPFCEKLIKDGYSDLIIEKTGLKPDAYFSASKIKWILDNIEGAREHAENGDYLFGTIDTWLVWKLTDGRVHVTDITNASRTMLCNIHTGEWDDELLELFGIPRKMLPEIKSSSEIYGTANIMGAQIPIAGIAGDQQAALFGQGCFAPGDAKTTYGTGVFLLANIGTDPVSSTHGLLTTVAATCKGEKIEYALEGSVFVGGAVIQWLRDELKIIHEALDSEYFAKKVTDTCGVYIVPAFAGLGAPYWNMNARGAVTGLSRGVRREHIIRAALESIAYQTEDVLEAMESDTGKKIPCLRVDGGASANDFLVQFQADISNAKVFRPSMKEATAAGAAYLAGLAVGFFKDRNEISRLCTKGDIFDPEMEEDKRRRLLAGWHAAVTATTANADALGGL